MYIRKHLHSNVWETHADYICMYLYAFVYMYMYIITNICVYNHPVSLSFHKTSKVAAVVIYTKYKSGNRHRKPWDEIFASSCVTSGLVKIIGIALLRYFIYIYIHIHLIIDLVGCFCLISAFCTTITNRARL